ncbi:MAG: hypothetical protein O3B01_23470 [Planctomycetota bacterium]|nr:hypothetical protein [Planctomycetota bacterium]
MISKVKLNNQAFTIIEFLMAVTVTFTLSSIVIGVLHIGFRRSLQAHCTKNTFTLWNTMKIYRTDNRGRYPSEYPTLSLLEMMGSSEAFPKNEYQLPNKTFTCVEYEPPIDEETGTVKVKGQGKVKKQGKQGQVYEEPEDVSADVYSNYMIMMRDLAPSNTSFLTCPYHDEGGMAVAITFNGRAFANEREPLTLDGDAKVEPLSVLSNGKFYFWDNGFIDLQGGPTIMYSGTYTDGDTLVINLKVEENSTGSLDISLPANSRLNLLSSVGLVIFESSKNNTFKFDADFEDTSGYKAIIVGDSGQIQKFGRNIVVSSQ